MDDGWVVSIGGITLFVAFAVIGTIWERFQKSNIWERSQKSRRILTEGTVTSITRQKKRGRLDQSEYIGGAMDFEFYVGGQRWTGHKTVRGDLAHKEKGDRIHVYYLPKKPGKAQMLGP